MKEEMRAKTFAHLMGIDREIELVCQLASGLLTVPGIEDPIQAAKNLLALNTGLKVSNWANYEKRFMYAKRTCDGTVEEG